MRASRKDIGLAIVGSGRIGTLRGRLAAMHPSVRFIGVMDTDAGAASKLSAAIDAPFCTTELEAVLSHPEVNAVIVSSSEGEHTAPVIAALKRGMPVLVEKPIALTVPEADLMLRSRPGTLNFPSAGRGTSSHLAGELFNTMARISMVHVPYRGGGPAFADLLGWQVQLFFATMPAAMPFVKSGRLRALAVTSSQRSASLPDLPTISESGLPGYNAVTWYGLLAPRGTPVDVIERLNRETNDILRQPDMREKFLAQGFEPARGSPAEFAAFIGGEIVKWAQVVRAAGIAAE